MLTFRPFQGSAIFELPDPDRPEHIHKGRTKAELVAAITNYRAQNQLEPIERLDLVIDNYLCSLPENTSKCRQVELQRGIMAYLKGGLALVKVLALGAKSMVSQDVADERGSICKDCTYNSFPDRGRFVEWSDEIAWHTVGDKKSAHHDSLGNCECCSCPLKAKVWMKGPFELTLAEQEMMKNSNVSCWQLKEAKDKDG